MNPKEKAANKEAFRKMSMSEKVDYIRTYYWGPILLGMIAVIILISAVHRQLTKKEPILYTAFINIVIGSELEEVLHQGFLHSINLDEKKNEIIMYPSLYLSADPSAENHEISYTSRMKLLATINSKQLDFVMMNREAYDILSGSEYLLDLHELSGQDEALFRELEPILTENAVILEDNAIDITLNQADTYQAVTKDMLNGIDLSGISAIKDAGFPETVYMGIIANTPRLAECCDYLNYLLDLDQTGA